MLSERKIGNNIDNCNFCTQVRVFTFAVGPPAESTQVLQYMACKNRGKLVWLVCGYNTEFVWAS